MLLPEQAATMLSLQESMNAKVDPDWIEAKYPYLRAVAIEGSEAIEHHGWKWWKKQDKDLAQLQMELIDIWHFLLSEILLRNKGSQEESIKSLLSLLNQDKTKRSLHFDNQEIEISKCDLILKLELLIATSVTRRIELSLFEAIMFDCELSWSDLYCQYVGKNVLNMFRQDNGYKQGTYKKIWNAKEDNEHLVDIINSLDSNHNNFKDQVYAALQDAYPS